MARNQYYDPIFREATRKKFGISELEEKLQHGTEEYQNFESGQQKFLDALRQALLRRDEATSSLEKQRRGLQEQFSTISDKKRKDYIARGITDPFVRQELTQKRRASLEGQLGGLEEAINRRVGTREQTLQTGLAGYQSNLERQKTALSFLADQLQGKQQESEDYLSAFVKDEEDKKDYVGRGSVEKEEKITQADKTDYNASLSGLGEVVVTSGVTAQEGQITREEAIQILQTNYPWKSPVEIAKDVYELYQDTYR